MIMTAQHGAEEKIPGFQSPANAFAESRLKITDCLEIDPDYPVYFQMDSLSMKNHGLLSGDILVIDRTLTPVSDSMVVAFVNGCFYCRQYSIINNKPVLIGDDDELANVGNEIFQICGVVTAICRHTLPMVLRTGRYRRICTL
jgi:DNA polymerase V